MTHISVLKDELVDGLEIKSGDIVVDGTLGGGGHTREVIERFGKSVKIICFDLDLDAIKRVKEDTKNLDCDITFVNSGFQDIDKALENLGLKQIDRLMLDLGLSSFQIESSDRGFSFQRDEPLLMTMKKDPSPEDLTAREIVNNWGEETLANIIYGFGEERYSRKIAEAIVLSRQDKEIKTTFDLVKIIDQACGKYYKKSKIHPATKTFQALRIAVNRELNNLEEVIDKGFNKLNIGGRIGIISFHSLEDRIVKREFRNFKEKNLVKIISKKPITPSEREIKNNPRSRSAKLRIIEKIK